jgi:hypothetical protein
MWALVGKCGGNGKIGKKNQYYATIGLRLDQGRITNGF